MKSILGFDEVRRLLPQSYPFVMIDAVEELQREKRIVCLKNVTGNEWMFPGHFPQKALFPGVLLIEGLAQAAILMVKAGTPQEGDSLVDIPEDATYMLAGVKARFLKPVVPGDQLRFVCEALRFASTGGVVEGQAYVDGEMVAKADLTFMIQSSQK